MGSQQSQRSGRSKEKEVASRESSSSASLSRESLARHDERVYPRDQRYAQGVVRDEQNRNFYRALHGHYHPNESEEDLLSDAGPSEYTTREVASSVGESLRLHHHRPIALSEPPLKRFATIDGANEPFPTYSKRSMSDNGIRVGDMETVQRREDASERLSKEAMSLKRTNSGSTGRITASSENQMRLQLDRASQQAREYDEEPSEY
ncbi:MAG: hypothetical protein Q9165_003639 [Trypethelium subeluteriae]